MPFALAHCPWLVGLRRWRPRMCWWRRITSAHQALLLRQPPAGLVLDPHSPLLLAPGARAFLAFKRQLLEELGDALSSRVTVENLQAAAKDMPTDDMRPGLARLVRPGPACGPPCRAWRRQRLLRAAGAWAAAVSSLVCHRCQVGHGPFSWRP